MLAALDQARDTLSEMSLQASRISAFHVLSGAERTGERLPWLRARAAALHERARSPHGVAATADSDTAWTAAGAAAERLMEAAAGADALPDGVDGPAAAAPARRLQRIGEALDVVEERLGAIA